MYGEFNEFNVFFINCKINLYLEFHFFIKIKFIKILDYFFIILNKTKLNFQYFLFKKKTNKKLIFYSLFFNLPFQPILSPQYTRTPILTVRS